jgi:Na+-translocating ferredoxin:NAD+ oxidoreductase RnfG subunit
LKNIFQTLSNCVILLLLILATVSYKGKLFGHKVEELTNPQEKQLVLQEPNQTDLSQAGFVNSTLENTKEGAWTIINSRGAKIARVFNSLKFSEGVNGFGGPVPLFVYINNNGEVLHVQALENNESTQFWQSVVDKGILSQWIGKSNESLGNFIPDAVSGATLSSKAVNQSMQKTISSFGGNSLSTSSPIKIDYKTVIALLVVLSGAFMSFYGAKSKALRTIQLVINVVVLGFWCGRFMSIKALQSLVSNGTDLVAGSFVLLTLLLTIALPLLFKKQSFYCTWVCPLGSAQELAGRVRKKKIKIPKAILNLLKHSKAVITMAMFFLLWLGLASSVVEYEPFTIFIYKHASVGVIIIASVTILSSIFINRPWCRFACPTGQVLTWINKFN